MLVLAHILGAPVEEFLMPLAGGGLGAGMLLVLASVMPHVRDPRRPH